MLTLNTATPQDDPHIVALLNATFRTPVTLEDWDWFTRGCPYGLGRTYVVKDGENIVGAFPFLPTKVWIKGELHEASLAHHLAIRPKYRNVTNFVRLSHHAFRNERARGSQLLITAANQSSCRPHKALMGWEDFGYADFLYKTSLPSQTYGGWRIIGSFGTDFDAFYRVVIDTLDFCFHKTSAWMNWRFRDRPGEPYIIFTAGDDGYVVLKYWEELSGYLKAHIIDLHALNAGAFFDLIAAAESYAVGCDELNLWSVQGYPYRSLLEGVGFAAVESKRQPIIIYSLDGSSIPFPDGAASHSYGDGDSQY